MKNKKVIAIIASVLIVISVVTFSFWNHYKHTSFKELVIDELTRQVEEIELFTRKSEEEKYVSIKSESKINEILDDLSGINLTKVKDSLPQIGEYEIFIVAGYNKKFLVKITEDYMRIRNYQGEGLKKYSGWYKMSNTNMYNIIEELYQNEPARQES